MDFFRVMTSYLLEEIADWSEDEGVSIGENIDELAFPAQIKLINGFLIGLGDPQIDVDPADELADNYFDCLHYSFVGLHNNPRGLLIDVEFELMSAVMRRTADALASKDRYADSFNVDRSYNRIFIQGKGDSIPISASEPSANSANRRLFLDAIDLNFEAQLFLVYLTIDDCGELIECTAYQDLKNQRAFVSEDLTLLLGRELATSLLNQLILNGAGVFEEYCKAASSDRPSRQIRVQVRSSRKKPKKKASQAVGSDRPMFRRIDLFSDSSQPPMPQKPHDSGNQHWTLDHEVSVKGHYRLQRFGKGRRQVKKIWIKDFKKGAGKGEDLRPSRTTL